MVNVNGGTHRSHASGASFDLRQKGRYGAGIRCPSDREKLMKTNMGTADRVVRVVVGLLPLATALGGYCPL